VIARSRFGSYGWQYVSHEFLVPAAIGEDAIVKCLACGFGGAHQSHRKNLISLVHNAKTGKLVKQVAIELGHVFQLGLEIQQCAAVRLFLDEDGKQKPIVMGCYGIGVSRLIAAMRLKLIMIQMALFGRREVAPFDVEILPLQVE
jgi:prolyl-tRNA synthetase